MMRQASAGGDQGEFARVRKRSGHKYSLGSHTPVAVKALKSLNADLTFSPLFSCGRIMSAASGSRLCPGFFQWLGAKPSAVATPLAYPLRYTAMVVDRRASVCAAGAAYN